MIIYIDNTNVITLARLKSAVDNSYIDDAVVDVTIVDNTGAEVAGGTWPMQMTIVTNSPPQGTYRAVLPADVSLTPDDKYYAVVDVDGGLNRKGHWEVPFTAKVRGA